MRRLLSFVSMGLIAVVILSGCNEKNISEHDKYKDGTTVTEKESGNEKEHRDDIVFANEDLENMVREIIEKIDGEITKEDLQKVTYLGIDNAGLKDISVLKHMTNLQELDLRENEIVDITPLKDLKKLKELSLTGNKIVDISPLQELTSLTSLYINKNEIEDILALKGLINLQILNISSNKIEDIESLNVLKELTFLDLEDNNVSDITPLKNKKKLNTLYLQGNNIGDFSPTKSYYDNLEWKDFKLKG